MNISRTIKKSLFLITASVLLMLNSGGVLSVVQAAEKSQEAPTITLLGPQRNKKLPIESSEKITWKATYIKDNYLLILNLENDEADLLGRIGILSGDEARKGSYVWFIRDFTSDDIADRIREGRYRITATLYDGEVCLWHDCEVTNPGKEIARSMSDYFTITPAKPPIKLLAPQKGNAWKHGSKKLIRWKTNNAHPEISITLYRETRGESISPGNAILYPNGGENLSVNQSVTITYKISDNFRKRIFADSLVELYLLRTDGVLEGYIGNITDYSKTAFVWDPQKLQHWGGLDTTSRAPKAGQYKVLILARSKTPPPTFAGDYPVDIFVDGYDKFDGHQILVIRDGKTLSQRELIASDVSDSSFGLKQVSTPTPTPTQTPVAEADNGKYVIAKKILNRQSFNWRVDKKIPPGKYTLEVYDEISGDIDESEVFSIIGTPTNPSL